MKLLVALGNIGKEYKETRHNFGFLLLDKIASNHQFSLSGVKYKSEILTGNIGNEKIIAIKPQTFMNLSGEAVISIMSFYKIAIEDILVFHDDLDLAIGKVKVKIGGGNAGHNGLKSIDANIGSNYMRLRLGIGRPQNAEFEVSNFVLGKFSKDEKIIVEEVNEKCSKLIARLLENDMAGFMNEFSIMNKKNEILK